MDSQPALLASETLDNSYFAASDGVHGLELWKTDGTATGTIMVADVNSGPGDAVSDGAFLALSMNDRITVVLDDGTHGQEWWSSDGTETGTSLIADIYPGPMPSLNAETAIEDRQYAVAGSSLYFVAEDGRHGQELWKTRGDESTTELVMDIAPLTGDAGIDDMVIAGGSLFFAADDGIHGLELWRLPGITTTSNDKLLERSTFELTQPFPNPTRTASWIGITVPETQRVTVELFDVLGRRTMTIRDEVVQSGEHRVHVNVEELSAGLYFMRVSTASSTQSASLIVMH